MKYKKLILLILIAGSSLNFREVSKTTKESFAIVELFTSEGCSSCPAADELLKEMPDILNKENKNVIGLSFHVTYWNRLGWEDPYSSEVFTDRQKKYVAKLNLPQLYTPQAIVNGETEFIGSNPIAFRNLVTAASEKKPSFELVAQANKENDKVRIVYEFNRDPKNMVLNIAVIEKDIVHYVPRGENKNRTLKHTNVVRVFETIRPQEKGEITVSWPTDLEVEKGTIVLYIQNAKSLKISGATQLDLKNK